MKTDDLVTMLAAGAVDIAPGSAMRRFAGAMGGGVLGSAILMLALLGVRPDLNQVVWMPMFWVKIAFVASLALISGVVALRMARPGSSLAWVPATLAAPVIVVWTLAAFMLVAASPSQRHLLVYGQTSASCPFLIAMLSLPVFVAVIWAMRGLAPTRLRLAGAAAGLAAGSLAALVYSLHCPELTPPFIGTWYLLGIMIPTGVGAALGPRLLRW